VKKIGVLFLLLLLHFTGWAQNAGLTDLCRKVLERHVGNNKDISMETSALEETSRPLFVTLKKGNRTRGCAGTMQPFSSTLSEELAYFTINAATRDFRYPPISPYELKDIVIVLTFPGELRAIKSLTEYNPWKHGLLIKKDGKQGVILPCEGKTSSYAVKKAMAQAGIDNIENADICIFDCETIMEIR